MTTRRGEVGPSSFEEQATPHPQAQVSAPAVQLKPPPHSLEARFLELLERRSGKWVKTSDIAREAGWLDVSSAFGTPTAIFIAVKLERDGLLECTKEDGRQGRWYVRIPVADG